MGSVCAIIMMLEVWAGTRSCLSLWRRLRLVSVRVAERHVGLHEVADTLLEDLEFREAAFRLDRLDHSIVEPEQEHGRAGPGQMAGPRNTSASDNDTAAHSLVQGPSPNTHHQLDSLYGPMPA